MKTLAFFAFLTAFSTALVFVGGALWAWGSVPLFYAYAATALGSGWLGISYGSLLGYAGRLQVRLLHLERTDDQHEGGPVSTPE